MEPILATVIAWQDAVNDQNVEHLLALSDPNIEIRGPRGSGAGHDLLREWLANTQLQLTTLRTFQRDDRVVLAQHGVWYSVGMAIVVGEAKVASSFRVHDERVIQFARYDSLDDALAAADLGVEDEVVERSDPSSPAPLPEGKDDMLRS